MGIVPCHDLALARLYGQPQWGLDALIAEHRAGAPGIRDSFEVVLDARPWSLWAVAVDSAGNESCRGEPLQVNGALAVDPAPAGLWLGAPRPNPASGLVAVPFCMPEAGTASLEIFDVHGPARGHACVRGPCRRRAHRALGRARGRAWGLPRPAANRGLARHQTRAHPSDSAPLT